MTRNSDLNSQEIFEALFQLCTEKKTGTFFIATDENISCQIILQIGEIAAAVYNSRIMGFDALKKIKATNAGRYIFSDGLILPVDETALIEHTQNSLKFLGFSQIADDSQSIIEVQDEPKQRDNEIVCTYRGQKIIKTKVQVQPSAEQKVKPKRIYRGQVVRD
ncbi:MAG: hypothetical protein GQ569_09105 [Methylococcaceae bacterium]|nr:hypothetical protein [Methylococcaceae bacterium]